MSFLLDTNVISEVVRPEPDASVAAWLAGVDPRIVHISVVSLAEIRFGIERLEVGAKRSALESWWDRDLAAWADQQLIDIDRAVATAWGSVIAQGRRVGKAVTSMDGFIAATALVHDLTLVTRNLRDFEGLGVRLLDPWTAT